MSNWKDLIRKEEEDYSDEEEAERRIEAPWLYEDSTDEMHDKTEQSYERIRELFEEAIKIADGIENRTQQQVDLVRFLERILAEGYYRK
jgi:thymidylate kinase